LTVLRETLTQYITFIRGERGVCTLLLCSLTTLLSCIDPSERISDKIPKVGPLLISLKNFLSVRFCGKYVIERAMRSWMYISSDSVSWFILRAKENIILYTQVLEQVATEVVINYFLKRIDLWIVFYGLYIFFAWKRPA
jgi:hypothetical protein